jgi:hypothetical protein
MENIMLKYAMAIALTLALPAAPAPPTVVSITFDDGDNENPQAASLLEAHGMRGTFFIVSGYLGFPAYVTLSQVQTLQAAGHEIGGHTLTHQHLPALSLDDAQHQICDDRAALTSHGLNVQTLAYPFGESNSAVEAIAAACGYSAARSLGEIPDTGLAETIPPVDPYSIRAPWSIKSTYTLATIEGLVTGAESVGGWLPLVFHHLCNTSPCDTYSIRTSDFTALLDWLATRPSTTTVKTMRDVVGSAPPAPSVAITSPADGTGASGTITVTASASAAAGISRVDFLASDAVFATATSAPYSVNWNTTSVGNGAIPLTARAYDALGNNTTSAVVNVNVSNGGASLLQNPSLESDVNANGVPDCWQKARYGTNSVTWTRTSDAHDGSFAERIDVTSLIDGGARLVPALDSGQCAPSGTPGRTYSVSGWYKSSVAPQWVLFYREQSGVWSWWADGPVVPAASTWTQTTFTTPVLPSGATALSFGLSLYSAGSLTVDDFSYSTN